MTRTSSIRFIAVPLVGVGALLLGIVSVYILRSPSPQTVPDVLSATSARDRGVPFHQLFPPQEPTPEAAPAPASSPRVFTINDASPKVDLEVEIGECDRGDRGLCSPLIVRFSRKKASQPFQTITHEQTSMWDSVPKANITRRYDDQSIINFGDFNFDGHEDVAICDGNNGGYGSTSYQVYLYSDRLGRYVHDPAFSELAQGTSLGMFETDEAKKIHYVFSKSSCCWHWIEGFDVHRGKPRKIYEQHTVLAHPASRYEITTKKLIRGRWRSWVKYEPAD